jgi:hypothetical protein
MGKRIKRPYEGFPDKTINGSSAGKKVAGVEAAQHEAKTNGASSEMVVENPSEELQIPIWMGDASKDQIGPDEWIEQVQVKKLEFYKNTLF